MKMNEQIKKAVEINKDGSVSIDAKKLSDAYFDNLPEDIDMEQILAIRQYEKAMLDGVKQTIKRLAEKEFK